ncbi:hypothetical protein [Streptomyces scabiei]|uniref:hypothetical protein n=1 Tax=Streptomyces scabiei TaxID=1930 RepID=UPI0029B9F743|nr:hypothetical protein [Streptomyces scabiei]MDX3122772.1 hypothetical protein [Streptomyces scabiei]MDX3199371.1 hypothetical protein [Streptomyces scabiei]MDX3223189.1 hypothetical protein [Streptomyces scabiei]
MPSPHKPTAKKLIEDAISHLRQGGPARPDLADAVKELAEQRFRGWTGIEGTVVSFRADRDLLTRVGEGRLTQVAQQGCEQFLAGELQPTRTVRGPAGQKAPTSVRIPEDLLARVDARCKAMSAELGWNVKPVNVFVSALEADAAPRE